MGAYFLCRFFGELLILLLYLFLLTLIYCIVVSHQKNKSYWSIELIISVLLHDTFQLLFILQFAYTWSDYGFSESVYNILQFLL